MELDRTPIHQIEGVSHTQPLHKASMIKIMLVEDNIRARHALKALISQQEEIIILAEASNGQEAIRKIEVQIPDLIIMDMRMPIMDGLETTKIIKTNWSQVKVIILTIYPDYQVEALSAGADAFLVKGCPTEELIAAILNQRTDTPSSPRFA